MESGATRINRKQRPCRQLRGHLLQSRDERLPDGRRAEVVRANLYDAGLSSLGCSQDGAEIQVMRQYDIIVFGGVGHDLDIGRVHTTYA